jgi:hypothetical protein
MASDLPDFGHHDSTHMARVLVQYMDNPDAIRARLREDFHNPPTVTTIRRYRTEYLAARAEPAEEIAHKAHEGYYPADVSKSAEAASKRFLERLERERAYSVVRAKTQGALDSPSLRQPAIVNRAWDRETEQAWLQNEELRL